MTRMEAERMAMDWNNLKDGCHYWACELMYNWVVWCRDRNGKDRIAHVEARS